MEQSTAASPSTPADVAGRRFAGRDFSALWVGRGANAVGVQVRTFVFPLLAVHILGAGTVQVGIMHACASAAYLLVGLPAGPLVDRLPKRRVLITANLASALVVSSVILGWHLGVLTLPLLYAITLLLGVSGVITGVAFLSLIPEVVASERVAGLAARVSIVQTLAQVTVPAAAGVLIGITGPVTVLSITVTCLLLSAACVGAVRARPVPPQHDDRQARTSQLIAEGLRYVRSQPTIRRITLASAADAGFGGIWQAALVVYLITELHASDAQVGLIFAIAAAGGVLGATAAPRIINRWGNGAALRWWLPASNGFGLLMVFAVPGTAAFLVAVADFAMMAGALVFNVSQTSTRLRLCPQPMLGRMNATIRTTIWSASALGSLAGAGLGALLAPRWVVLVGIVAGIVATWLTCGARPFRETDEQR